MRLLIVGAGIVGAALAYEAARAGADVVLLDKSLPASGVTADSFAWIGGPRAGDAVDPSTPLRHHVLPDYRRLERDVPGVRVHWRGSLTWDQGQLGDDRRPGPDEHVVDAAGAGRLEPHLRVRPEQALHVDSHAAVDPVAVTQALVRSAREHGAQVLTHTAVTAVIRQNGQVRGVRTSIGPVDADAVVVTAGADAPVLCRPLGFELPVTPSPAVLMRFAARPGLVRTLVVTAGLEVREAAGGELLVAAEYHGETDQEQLLSAGEEMLRQLTGTFATRDVRLISVRAGARPMPVDGLPIIGPVPGTRGLHVAVMHSGITLAPSAGRLLAAEIVHGTEAPEFAGLRPARFPSQPGLP